MDVLGQEETDVVEQTDLETGEQSAGASEQPAPTGDAEAGAGPAGTPEGQAAAEGQEGAVPAGEEAPALSAEAQLAAEALAVTQDSQAAAAGQETVPVSVVAELRADRRASRQLIEALQSQLAEKNKPAEAAPQISPLKKWVTENPEDAQVASPPAAILLAQQEWQDQQATVRVQEQSAQMRIAKGEQSYLKAKSALTDFDEVVELGSSHLDVGDKLNIAISDDPAIELYKRCQRATLQSGTPDAAIMRRHLQEKLAKAKQSASAATGTVSKNRQEKPAPAAPAPSAPAEPKTAVRNPRLAHVLATFDM